MAQKIVKICDWCEKEAVVTKDFVSENILGATWQIARHPETSECEIVDLCQACRNALVNAIQAARIGRQFSESTPPRVTALPH